MPADHHGVNTPDQSPANNSAGPSPAGDIRLRVSSLLARRVSVLTGAVVAGLILTLDGGPITTTHSPWTTTGTF